MVKQAIKVTGNVIDLSGSIAEFTDALLHAPMDKIGDKLAIRMKALCPVGKTGNLQKSINNRTLLFRKTATVATLVGPKRRAPGRPTKYAHLVEFGHNAGGWNAGGEYVAAHPFVRPTAEVARATVATELGAALSQTLSVAVKRAGIRKVGGKYGKTNIITTPIK